MSQPAREFIVKIVELSLWSSDFIIAHILLFILTPPILIPYADTIHATLLCKSLPALLTVLLTLPSVWLRPSKQIRAPLYSMKVKKQRQWIVIKYGIIYLCVSGAIIALAVIRRCFYSRSQLVSNFLSSRHFR